MVDEVLKGPDEVKLHCREGVDLVLIQNPVLYSGKKDNAEPSDQDGFVMIHSLSVSYRQERHPGEMAKFVLMHEGKYFNLVGNRNN